jgi:hypothetical protein
MGVRGGFPSGNVGGEATDIFHTAITQLDFKSPEAAAPGAGKSDDGGLV